MLQITKEESFSSKHGAQIFTLTMVFLFTIGAVLLEFSSDETYYVFGKLALPFLFMSIPFFLTKKSEVHISIYVFYKIFGLLLVAVSIHAGVGVFVESLRIF